MNCESFLHCVAEPSRHALLRHLVLGPSHVGPLAAAVGLEQTNASHHLRQLRECGFVAAERDGKMVRYRLSCPEVAAFLDAVDATQAAVARAQADPDQAGARDATKRRPDARPRPGAATEAT